MGGWGGYTHSSTNLCGGKKELGHGNEGGGSEGGKKEGNVIKCYDLLGFSRMQCKNKNLLASVFSVIRVNVRISVMLSIMKLW